MRVNLGRDDMAMAKELLDRADIVAVFKKLCRETVSQRVGGSVLRERLVQHASELAWRHGLRGYLQLASAAAWQQAIGRNVTLCTFVGNAYFRRPPWEIRPEARKPSVIYARWFT